MEFDVLDWEKSEVVFVGIVLAAIFGVSFYQLKIGEMKTRDAQRKADLELVGRALKRYWDDHQSYPPESGGKIVSCGDRGAGVCEWGGGRFADVDNVVYLKQMPRDPLTEKGWKYVYEMSGDKFRLYVGLEYGGDKGIRGDLTRECGNGVQCKWYVE